MLLSISLQQVLIGVIILNILVGVFLIYLLWKLIKKILK